MIPAKDDIPMPRIHDEIEMERERERERIRIQQLSDALATAAIDQNRGY